MKDHEPYDENKLEHNWDQLGDWGAGFADESVFSEFEERWEREDEIEEWRQKLY